MAKTNGTSQTSEGLRFKIRNDREATLHVCDHLLLHGDGRNRNERFTHNILVNFRHGPGNALRSGFEVTP
jgi:hypothetical protein